MNNPRPIADLLASLDMPRTDALTREEWAERHRAADADLREVERAEGIRRALSTVPLEFRWVLEDGWKRLLLARCKLAPEAIKDALESTGDILVRGPSGKGKTSLAVAILRRRIEAGARGKFVSTIDALHAHKHQERSEQAWKAYRGTLESSLVLLDDIGFELAGGSAAATCEIVGKRRQGYANIWTTAFSDEQLSQHYGDGIRRRLTEAGRVTVVEVGA